MRTSFQRATWQGRLGQLRKFLSARVAARAVATSLAPAMAFLFAGCERPGGPPAPPPPAVTVSHPISREVIEWDEYTGHLESPESVNVDARVSGLILEAPFVEGSIVEKGKLLFVIDPSPFKADYEAKLADVSKAEAQTALANVQFQRADELHKVKSLSDQEYDNAVANFRQAMAVLSGAKAAAELSKLSLEWTQVVAPIKGRVSRKYVTPGNLINGGAGQATLLTTIQSIDPIYHYADVNEAAVLKYQQLARERKRVSARDAPIPVFMALGNETTFPHEGVVDFVDNKVDPGTGTIRARGVFPNPDGLLTPGFFARVRVPGSGRYTTLLVPDAAVGTDQNIKYLLVVNGEDKVEVRPVTLGAVFGRLRSIEKGVSVADRVIVNGLQSARPGSKVAPQEAPIPPDALQLTAPGSATTRELPATREISVASETAATRESPRTHGLPATASAGPAGARPTTRPSGTEGTGP